MPNSSLYSGLQGAKVCEFAQLKPECAKLQVNANCNCIQPLHDLGWGGVLTTLQTWDIWADTTRWAGSKSGEHADWPLLTVGSD